MWRRNIERAYKRPYLFLFRCNLLFNHKIILPSFAFQILFLCAFERYNNLSVCLCLIVCQIDINAQNSTKRTENNSQSHFKGIELRQLHRSFSVQQRRTFCVYIYKVLSILQHCQHRATAFAVACRLYHFTTRRLRRQTNIYARTAHTDRKHAHNTHTHIRIK